MECHTKALVISKIKYKDHDLIVKCYTRLHGLESFLLRGVLKNNRSQAKIAYFQNLSQLDIIYHKKPTINLQTIKEVKSSYMYKTVHTHILKSTVAIFLSEVLSLSIKEEHKNTDLFDFLESSLQWFDLKDNYTNFHLYFLLQLTKYLGFFPNAMNSQYSYFNLELGLFQNSKPVYCLENYNLTILKQLLGTTFDGLKNIKISSKQRQSFLVLLMTYFKLHLSGFYNPKSLRVLHDVFN